MREEGRRGAITGLCSTARLTGFLSKKSSETKRNEYLSLLQSSGGLNGSPTNKILKQIDGFEKIGSGDGMASRWN
jgi:hypothetical protein